MRRKSTRGAAAALALGLLGGALAALAGGGQPAAAATTLIQTCGFTANLPGTYVLGRDLACSGNVAIIVAADNVNLVLAGHTLTSAGAVDGVLARNVTGLKITGGTIVGFPFSGIFLDGTRDARVAGVTTIGSVGRRGIGIAVKSTTGTRLSGNTVTNGSVGIALNGNTGARLAGNTATDNGVAGISLFFDSVGNRVVGNTVTGNSGRGIEVQSGSTANQFLGNTATGNSPDLADSNLPACINTWQGNAFVTDNESGAAFGPGAGCIR